MQGTVRGLAASGCYDPQKPSDFGLEKVRFLLHRLGVYLVFMSTKTVLPEYLQIARFMTVYQHKSVLFILDFRRLLRVVLTTNQKVGGSNPFWRTMASVLIAFETL